MALGRIKIPILPFLGCQGDEGARQRPAAGLARQGQRLSQETARLLGAADAGRCRGQPNECFRLCRNVAAPARQRQRSSHGLLHGREITQPQRRLAQLQIVGQ